MTSEPTQSRRTQRAYSIREFCEVFSVSRSKTYLLLSAGDITAVKLGSKNLIPADEADRWFKSLTKTPEQENYVNENC